MGATVKSATISSRTVENAEPMLDGRLIAASPGVPPAAPVLTNFGTATAVVSGNKVTVVVTGGVPTTGFTITVLHSLGVAPRSVGVTQVSGPNNPQAVVLPASITSSQFVITGATTAPTTGTYVFEFDIKI